MQSKPRGYWSSVFKQATVLMRQKDQLNGETAFWLARDLVDRNMGADRDQSTLALSLHQGFGAEDTFVLAP
ncbi:MAG: hypothetical protein V4498_10360 [candidate division FCPU426 bacterium]